MKHTTIVQSKLRRDAERYRWLRKHFCNLIVRTTPTDKGPVVHSIMPSPNFYTPTDSRRLDRAIDAAIAEHP